MIEVNVNNNGTAAAGENPVATIEDKRKSVGVPASASNKTVRPNFYSWASASSLVASSTADLPVKPILPVTMSSLTFMKPSSDRRALLAKAMSWTAQKASGTVVQGNNSLKKFSEEERKEEVSDYSIPESNASKQNIIVENKAATMETGDNDITRKKKRSTSKSRSPGRSSSKSRRLPQHTASSKSRSPPQRTTSKSRSPPQQTVSSKSKPPPKRSFSDKQRHEESKDVAHRRRRQVSRANSESSTKLRQKPGTRPGPRPDAHASNSRRRLLQPADQNKRLSSRELLKRAASARTLTDSNGGNKKADRKSAGAALNKCRMQRSTSESSNKKNQSRLPQSAAANHSYRTSGQAIQDGPPLQRAASTGNMRSKKIGTERRIRGSRDLSRRGNSSTVQGTFCPPRLLQKAASARNLSNALGDRRPLRQRLQKAASARSLAAAVESTEGNEGSPAHSIERTSYLSNKRARGSSRCRRSCQMHTLMVQAQLLSLSQVIQEREQKEEDIKKLHSKYNLKQTINYDSSVPCDEKTTTLTEQVATTVTSRLERDAVPKMGISLVRSLFGPEL